MESFEDKIDIIDNEIAKRRGKWQLSALASIDYDDVSQIIRLHVYKKWELWDQNRPLENWLHTVISHQIANLIRNNYGNVAPPCQGSPPCPCNQGGDLCSFTPSGTKCSDCPLYAKWEKSKKAGYEMKLASSIHHPDFVEDSDSAFQASDNVNFGESIGKLHDIMMKSLKDHHKKVYKLLYIENMEEKEAAKQMGYTTTEEHRYAGYKQIHNIKKEILRVAKKLIAENDIIS